VTLMLFDPLMRRAVALSHCRWCKPRDHVVTQPTIKSEIWSRKAKIDLIRVWHNGNLSQGTYTIGMK
jgi:hypothetical protein